MNFQENLAEIIKEYYGTNEEMDKKSDIERNKVFLECFKDLATILERDYQISLNIIPTKVIGEKNAIS